ncbi:MAG TPA: malate permease [Eubacteriaceae bacterium]|nr:malate permease [Eubacteriaceae bacterium]
MLEILPNVMPVLLLIGLGYFFKAMGVIKSNNLDEIKKILLNISLPSLLFLNFKTMDLKLEYIGLTLIIFCFFALLFLLGQAINRIKPLYNPILPYLLPNFAFGTLGVPLFLSIFGIENLSNFTILSIGHEFFVWFVLIVLIKKKFSDEGFSINTLKEFIKNPFILAVVFGLLINITGFNRIISTNPILLGIEKFLESLSTILTPLILIIVGYDMKLNKKYIKESGKILAIRMALILIIGYILKFVFIDRILVADKIFDYAWFTYLILPPSIAIALMIGSYSTEENKDIAANTVVLGTIVNVIVYVSFVLACL